MKKLLFLGACFLSFFLPYSNAEFTGNSQAIKTNASDVKNLKDGDFISLTGTIKTKIGNEKYLFEDSTGSITVEIDDEKLLNLKINPDDLLIIEGEVDKDFNSLTVEADNVKLSR